MQNDGMQILQPTALTIRQAPNSSATINTGSFPAELTVTLRHIPQPENLAKSCGRTGYTTYHAYLINNSLNTKTFLGAVGKIRPGTFQLIAEHIPPGTWDQLVISLTRDNPADLGMPVFTFSHNFSNLAPPPERFTALPADPPKTGQPQARNILPPRTKQGNQHTHTVTASDSGLLKPGVVLPEPDPAEQTTGSPDTEDESLLLQPGKVLPENGVYAGALGTTPSHEKIAPLDGPAWFNLGSPGDDQPEQTIIPVIINELPYHALWLVNYRGSQLVGYVYDPANPQKPTFIIHGVPGDHSRNAQPKEQGYDYWVANPTGKGGYWLRYVNPYDNHIAHPFPVNRGRGPWSMD